MRLRAVAAASVEERDWPEKRMSEKMTPSGNDLDFKGGAEMFKYLPGTEYMLKHEAHMNGAKD